MSHKSYGKIYHIDREECEGILNGVCYIQEKIDGANLSIWKENGELFVGSRTQTVGTDKIKSGFRGAVEYVNNHEGIKKLFTHLEKKHNTNDVRLYGEWLVPHTITNYNKDAYNHFYLFDIEINGERIELDEVIGYSHKFNINQPFLFGKLKNPSKSDLDVFIGKSTIGPVGEGIVIKNSSFINKFGNRNYAKMVSEDFKENNGVIFGNSTKRDNEMSIITKYLNLERVKKIMNKIEQNEGVNIEKKHISQILGMVWYDIITEEANNISKYGVVDFSRLKGLTIKKTRLLALNYFDGGQTSVAFDNK